jgi:hypothetical protein
MKPYDHCKISVKRFGGIETDYIKIHDFIDSSKAHVPDMRHRAILHSSFGIYLTEQMFGTNITNSAGRLISVRDVAEQHVLDDLGKIPTVQDYLQGMPMYDWLGGPKRKKRNLSWDDFETASGEKYEAENKETFNIDSNVID